MVGNQWAALRLELGNFEQEIEEAFAQTCSLYFDMLCQSNHDDRIKYRWFSPKVQTLNRKRSNRKVLSFTENPKIISETIYSI